MTALRRPARLEVDRRSAIGVVSACVLIAGVSLSVPAAVTYDAWAWLTWGREIVHLDLDTTGGPSWKPLPMLVTTPLALFGSWAPTAWLVVVRTCGLLALVAAYRVGRTLAGRVAGVLAVVLLVLTPDVGPRYVRLVLEGHSAPITAAIVLFAVDRHLARRSGQTLLLLTLLALDRPEAWPFLGLYGLWMWRRRPDRRLLVVGCSVSVVVLWFGVDWVGSGSALYGADTAQVSAADRVRLWTAVRRASRSVIEPAWIAAGLAAALAVVARRRLEDASAPGAPQGVEVVPALLAAALVWDVLVVSMASAFGFAAISRFFLPAAALVAVLAAVGAVWAVSLAPPVWRRALVITAMLVCAAAPAAARITHVGALLQKIESRAATSDDLEAVVRDAGGAEVLRRCGPLSIDQGLSRTELAWLVSVPLDSVGRVPSVFRGVMVAGVGGEADVELGSAGPTVELLGRNDRWAVYAAECIR